MKCPLPSVRWKGLGLLRVEDVRRPQGLLVSLDRVAAPEVLLAGNRVRSAWPLRRYHGHLLVAVALEAATPEAATPEVRLEWFDEG